MKLEVYTRKQSTRSALFKYSPLLQLQKYYRESYHSPKANKLLTEHIYTFTSLSIYTEISHYAQSR